MLFPFLSFFPFRLPWLPQNAVYVLPDNVVFLDLFFQLAVVGAEGFFLLLQLFIFRLQGGKVRQFGNASRL